MRPPVRRSDRRREYIRLALPWLGSIAVTTVFALIFQVRPDLVDDSAIGVALPTIATRAWTAGLLIGCVLVLNGARTLDARWDVAGCVTLATWAITYSYAVFAVRGARTGFVACCLFAWCASFCLIRAVVLAYEPQGLKWRSPPR